MVFWLSPTGMPLPVASVGFFVMDSPGDLVGAFPTHPKSAIWLPE